MSTTKTSIHVGHRPDPDDAFMFHALANAKIDTGPYEFHHELVDIETLNRRAFKGDLELTAVSLHGYAHKLDVLDRLPRWPTQRDVMPTPKFLTIEETSRLIAAAEPMDPWNAMSIDAVRTGGHNGEVTAVPRHEL